MRRDPPSQAHVARAAGELANGGLSELDVGALLDEVDASRPTGGRGLALEMGHEGAPSSQPYSTSKTRTCGRTPRARALPPAAEDLGLGVSPPAEGRDGGDEDQA